MSRSFLLSDELAAYVEANSDPIDEVLADLRSETTALGDIAAMQIGPEQGALLSVLAGAIAPSLAVEVGTFTGYSALCVARVLAPGGRLLCCDISEEWTSIGQRAWERAGVADRIDLVLAPATETLAALDDEAVVDFAFIDADKPGYVDYYEAVLPRMSKNGLIVVDNVLWFGAVIDESNVTDDTEALRAFNRHVTADPRVQNALAPVGDGIQIIRRVV